MKITKETVKNLIKEEVRRVINEYGQVNNDPPPRESNWSDFAKGIDVGVLDLDTIAYDLGFRDFADMDISMTPRDLASRDPERFVQVVRDSSVMALNMSPDEILTYADARGGY
jgi:hypothetical protein